MIFKDETKTNRSQDKQQKVQCMDCHCIGTLNQKNEKVFLVPDEVLTTRSIHTQKQDMQRKPTWKKKITAKMSLAKHGSATDKQQHTYLILGSIFWITVMLIANFQSLEKSRGVTTYLTSTCHRNYKKCVKSESMDFCGHLMKECYSTKKFVFPEPVSIIEHSVSELVEFSHEENEINLARCQKKQFYDQKICRHLCSKTLVLKSTWTNPISPCEKICFALTRSFDAAGEVCPFQKYCSNGCPCPHYECDKLESYQKLVPVFDLQKPETIDLDDATVKGFEDEEFLPIDGITGRWEERERKIEMFPIALTDLSEKSSRVSVNASSSLFPYSTGATFLNGEHYLVDALGNLMRMAETDNKYIFMRNQDKKMRFFIFHFGSSIGTHQIQIRSKEKDSLTFPVVVICSPTARSDKCFYYAPDYNLNRFEEAQGFIASNHFNAKVSSASFKGVFYLMSVRMGDEYIKLSTTVSLSKLRKEEEMEKGWKKNEIGLPREYRELDPVHVISLTDLGRLILIIVTRSIALSNTQYSILLEAEGKFLTLGSEWMGSIVEYEDKAICFSKMFSQDDTSYIDLMGIKSNECSYFANAVVNKEKFYITNYVFEVNFAIEFDLEKITLDFTQVRTNKKMHVLSNPNFAFHDDVFPVFAKNAAFQPLFSRSASSFTRPFPKTIIPNRYFESFEESQHISTLKLKLNGKENFKFQIEFEESDKIEKQKTIMDLRFFDEKTFLSFGANQNGQLWIDSSFSSERAYFNRNSSKSAEFEFQIHSNSLITTLEIVENPNSIGNEIVLNKTAFGMVGLERIYDKRIRIFKMDKKTKIKNLIYFKKKSTHVYVLNNFRNPYMQRGDGSMQEVSLIANDWIGTYILDSRQALLNGQLHIFGGSGYSTRSPYQIARLERCSFTELSVKLNNFYYSEHQALSIDNGTRVIVCFDSTNEAWDFTTNQAIRYPPALTCDLFDGSNITTSNKTNVDHKLGGLELYNGKPTAIGGIDNSQTVETLTENGWKLLSPHPQTENFLFSTIGLPSGSLLTFANNFDFGPNQIYKLEGNKWFSMGFLQKIWQFVPQSDHSSLGTVSKIILQHSHQSQPPSPLAARPLSLVGLKRPSLVDSQELRPMRQDTTNEDKLAYDLSERVCQIMQTAVPSLRARKIATLCQRAKSIPERVIKQRSCAAALLTRVDSNLVLSLETLREWRDKMMAINAQRNEDCENNEDLDGTIGRFYSSMTRKITKAQRKPRKSKSRGKKN